MTTQDSRTHRRATAEADERPRVPGGVGAAESCCPASTATLPGAQRAAALADVFKALGDPTRVRLLGYVASAQGGTVCACHLPDELGISQPTLSHHLKKLVTAGLLTREQRGRWAHYTVVPEALADARSFLALTGA